VGKLTVFVNEMFGDFAKMALIRVIHWDSTRFDSFGKKRDSRRVITASFKSYHHC